MVKLMSSKLHRVRVTGSNLNYIGSIPIDSELLRKAEILPMQEIEIVNLSNGNRWSTYALPGKPDSGEICPNGGGVLLCSEGDLLIIFSYLYVSREELLIHRHTAKTLVFNESNACIVEMEHTLSHSNGKFEYHHKEYPLLQ